jgi:SET domain
MTYHLSCIPPSAKFHELATICHEHAGTCKLPDLDQESSFQCKIEEKIDRKFDKRSPKPKATITRRKIRGENPFFHSVDGRKSTMNEILLLSKLRTKFDDFIDDDLFYCLPCDLKEEVHLQLPSYKHIQCNQFDPVNRPPKVLSSGLEMCECIGFCGDDCLNRSLYVECYGEGPVSKKQSNCNIGNTCGNRLFSQRKFIRCKPKREEGKGWGLTVCESVRRGELIVEYVGEIIDAELKEKRLTEWAKEHPNDPNFYIMALQPGWFIDAREKANLSRFINHSCEPNTMIVPINVMGRIRCGVRAIRDIVANEFISYDYHFDTRHRDQFVCRCGSLKCRGSMQAGSKVLDMSSEITKKSKIEMFNEAKAAFELDKKFLHDYFEDAKMRSSLVNETVPGMEKENKDELIANGPQEKHKSNAQEHRIFLWRNAALGANFAQRFTRLDRRVQRLHLED